jgi:hypothetical protein
MCLTLRIEHQAAVSEMACNDLLQPVTLSWDRLDDTHIGSHRQHRLSDQISANTTSYSHPRHTPTLRITPVPVPPGEGLLSEPRAGAQLWPREPPFVSLKRPSLSARELGQLRGPYTSRCLRSGPGPLATTVKLGRASGALVLCMTLNAATGRPASRQLHLMSLHRLRTASPIRVTISLSIAAGVAKFSRANPA